MTVVVRTATGADARAIATVRIETWRVAYAGLIAQEVLDGLDLERETERRALHWDENHADPRTREFVAEVGGELAGWAAVGPSRDPDAGDTGEVYALYALPRHWSTGVGHALMVASERFLIRSGFHSAHLWYLEGNERAASFYERHGWIEDGAAKVDDRIVGGRQAHALHERRRVRDLGDR
ncbi:GNAT family N-acetyltransferase [Microbacterium sp. B2969]|uniref:GNAT family N-acetyltransferase n=1 Tax=Microbacterium alkaliflavum TaxID=3248839 RepID=A0ABW7Q2Y1_9MICO